jgi:hypothetical protein
MMNRHCHWGFITWNLIYYLPKATYHSASAHVLVIIVAHVDVVDDVGEVEVVEANNELRFNRQPRHNTKRKTLTPLLVSVL